MKIFCKNNILDVANILYKKSFIDERYNMKNKKIYKKRLDKWLLKHNISRKEIFKKL